VDGWCASEFLAGRHEPGRRDEVIAVGERLHAALRGIARPAFLDQRASAWAVADRVAWQQRPAGEFAAVRGLGRLAAARRPVTAPAQVVHGDLGGNVLFHPALPPAVIDFSPYWRPAGYATAIVVADALLWAGAGCVPAAAGPPGGFGQFLVRALIFRAVASWILSGGRDRQPVPGTAWTQAVNLACDLAAA
jgi:uncharacterized protein (TIGR02569 family)